MLVARGERKQRRACGIGMNSSVVFVLFFIFCIIMEMDAFSFVGFHRLAPSRKNKSSFTVLFKSQAERVGPPPPDSEVEDFVLNEEEEEEVPVIEIPSMSLDELLKPSPLADVNQIGPAAWAYIGDVVFELFVRCRFVWPTRKTADLQQKVVSLVRAEFQSKLLAKLLELFELTKQEEQIIARGRNSCTTSSKNRRNASAYQDATALEALVGYLYVTDQKRCEDVLNWIYAHLEVIDINE